MARPLKQNSLLNACAAALLTACSLNSLDAQEPAGQMPAQAAATQPAEPKPTSIDDLLKMDLNELSKVQPTQASPTASSGSAATSQAPTPQALPQTTVSAQTAGDVTASTTGELLNSAPSISLRRTSAINLDAKIRGFTSSQIQASAGGVPQIKTRIDIDSLFSQIDPAIVREIQVIDGPYVANQGPAFGFLVADLVEAPRFDGVTWKGKSALQFNANGGQIGWRQNFTGGSTDWGAFASVGQRIGNDYDPGHSSIDYQIPASYRQQDAYIALGRDFGAHLHGDFRYVRQDLFNVELPGVAYDLNRSFTNQFHAKFGFRENSTEPDAATLLFWTHRTSYGGDSSREAKQRTFFTTYLGDVFPSLDGGLIVGNGTSSETGARLKFQLGKLAEDNRMLEAGVDWQHVGQRYLEQDFDATGGQAFGNNLFGVPRSSSNDVGMFLQATWKPYADVAFTVGARMDYYAASLDSSDPITADTSGLADGRYLAGFNQPNYWLPMLFAVAKLEPAEGLDVTFSAASARRPPQLSELYNDQPWVPLVRFGNSLVDGNSDLDSERITQFDIGASKKWQDLRIGSRAFFASISNYILPVSSTFSSFPTVGTAAPPNVGRDYSQFIADPNDPAFNYNAGNAQLSYRYTNIARATMAGGELFGEATLREGLNLTMSAMYVKGVNHAPVRFVDETRTFVPVDKGSEALPGIYPFNGTIGLRWFDKATDRWSVDLIARLVHSQDYVADGLAEVRTPGFATFSLAGSFQLNDHVRLRTALLNLFDRTYYEHGSLAVVNRNGLVSFVKEPGLSWLTSLECEY